MEFNPAFLRSAREYHVRRIDHIAIVVRDIEQALGFYRDVLGFAPDEIREVPSEQVRIAFLPSGGPDGSTLELLEPSPSNASLTRFLEKRGEGLHHVCLEVDDIEAALRELREQGVTVLDEQPRQAAEGRALFIHPRSAHGVLLELLEK